MGAGCEGDGEGGGGRGCGGTGGEKQPFEGPHEAHADISHVYWVHHEEHDGGGGGGDEAERLAADPSVPAAGVAPSSGVVHAYWATVAVVSSDASSGTRSATIRVPAWARRFRGRAAAPDDACMEQPSYHANPLETNKLTCARQITASLHRACREKEGPRTFNP